MYQTVSQKVTYRAPIFKAKILACERQKQDCDEKTGADEYESIWYSLPETSVVDEGGLGFFAPQAMGQASHARESLGGFAAKIIPARLMEARQPAG
jgi:hypothetical protein